MTTSAIHDVMAELLVFVATATGYAGASASPEVVPEVVPIARPALEQRVCGKPCPVVALFDPRLGILVDDRLDVAGGAAAQSVLLHELVHYVQWRMSGRTAATCEEWLAREREAYRIQFAWLASLPDEVRGAVPERPNFSRLRCEGAPAQSVTQPHPRPVPTRAAPHSASPAGLDARAGFSYNKRD